MSGITATDLDAWRRAYPTATVADQKRFHAKIWDEYPHQSHYSADALSAVIEARHPKDIIELGGWDGEAAAEMLRRHDFIDHWLNIEICEGAVAEGYMGDDRYTAWCPDDWYWDHAWECDLFIASHTIEHLSREHLAATIGATTARALYLDAPLTLNGHSWWGTTTTHILDLGWTGVDVICARNGYWLASREEHALEPRSGGWSIVSVYETRT